MYSDFAFFSASPGRVAVHRLELTTGRLAGLDFGLTPDGAPLILRDVGTQEVYALDWHERQ